MTVTGPDDSEHAIDDGDGIRRDDEREHAPVSPEHALDDPALMRELFMESTTNAVFILDREGRFTLVNQRGCEMTGRTEADLIGRPLTDVLSADFLARASTRFREIAASGNALEQTDTELLRPDGTTIQISFNAAPIRRDGVFIGVAGTAEDVTERRQVEEALRRSEARYRTLAEHTFDLVCELDSAGRFSYASPNFKDILGYEPEELIGESPFDLMYPDDRDRVFGQFASALAEDSPPGTSTFRLRRADQTWCWLEVSANFYRDDAGESHAVILSRDIGERLAMEAEIRESDIRLRTFMENAPLILFATDSEGVFTLFEGQGLETLQLDAAQYLGTSLFTSLENLPEIIEAARRALAGETVTYRFSGERISLEVHQSPVRNAAGELTGTIGVGMDISDRLRAEQAQQKSEARYRAIFETHRAVRFLVDPASGLIVEANQAACDFYGYTAEELSGKPLTEINTLSKEELEEEFRRVRDENRTYLQYRHRLKSGEVRDVDVYTGPVDVDGRELFFSIIQDVTEQRRAEALLVAQRQLLEMVAVGAPLADVLERLTRLVEEHSAGALASILLVSADGTQLRHAAAPSLPASYSEAVDGLVIGPNAGSCGTAAYLRREVIAEDIATDPLWAEFRDQALSAGLRSCWSTPISSSTGEVLGTFAVYHREAGGARTRDRALIEIATHVAGIAIERGRSEAAVRSHTEELEAMYRRLAGAHADLEESQTRLEEKSAQLQRALEFERERARRDQLTGALNHAAITDEVRRMIDGGDPTSMAVAMLDVDGLKTANDTYGHQMGDAVLVLVAQKMIRDGAIVGRYGGDEFLAILPGADRARAEAYREGVLASLVGAGLMDERTGAQIPVVVSMGLAVYPQEAEAVGDLIRLSDSAMYASRRRRATGGPAASRGLGSERAAKMVGELVPLLTSHGELDDKLRLVAHRLSVGAGYDAVNFVVAGDNQRRRASTAIPGVDEERIAEWNRRQLMLEQQLVGDLLLRTMKPIIIDDLETTELVADSQRALLIDAGLHSALAAPMIWEDRLIGALTVASKQYNAFTLRDVEFVAAVATQVTAIVRMSSLVEELQVSTSQLQRAHEGTVLMLASAAEAHDHTTGRHLQRVRQITAAIADELGYDFEKSAELAMAATLHDIGKIRVPDSVLGSSNSLAEAEWVLMKQHTLWGSAFLSDQPGFELAASVARHHHERWDGAGYPDGLRGDDIPEGAQITTVADSFDAMTNNRPYRRGRPVSEAVAEIVSCSGTQFSPHVVDALVRLFDRGALAFVEPDEDLLEAA
jgi:diguanylate cyclase (GGDEF)-like protein/PAS domain S-box-containing protein